jgi:hypothetical protein
VCVTIALDKKTFDMLLAIGKHVRGKEMNA